LSIKDFFVETLNGVEGMDSNRIKINIDFLLTEFTKKIDELYLIENFDDKVNFIEETFSNIISNLPKSKSLENKK
jgi:hypothetical protein